MALIFHFAHQSNILSNQLIDALAGIYCLSDTFTEDYINREINMEKRSK